VGVVVVVVVGVGVGVGVSVGVGVGQQLIVVFEAVDCPAAGLSFL
jgi:hypothetical protein